MTQPHDRIYTTSRDATFIDEARARFSALDADKVDRAFVASAAYLDVVVGAVQAAKRTSQDEKRTWIAAVLTGAAMSDRPQGLDSEALLDTLAGLTAHELLILRWANTQPGELQVAYLPGELQTVDLDYHLHRLQAAGMVAYERELPPAGGSTDWRVFTRTPTFLRLMELIETGGGLGEPMVSSAASAGP